MTERVTSTEAEAEQVARGKPMEKLDRMSHVHFTNPEVRASLRLEMDRDDAATDLREEPEELKHDSP